MIAAGEPAPDFTLRDQDGENVSLADFRGRKLLIVFYPFDFSAVCTDQLSVLSGDQARDRARKASRWSGSASTIPSPTRPSRRKLGVDTTLLADFEPKGEVARAYDSYIEKSGWRIGPSS